MKYRCIIFDFDGTLADTEEIALAIYNELAGQYDYRPISQENLQKMKQMSFREMLDMTGMPVRKIPKILKMAQRRMKKRMDEVAPFDPLLKDRLLELKEEAGCLGVITSNTKRNVETFLKGQAIECFDFIIPSPLMSKQLKIQSVSKKYKLAKSDILYVGDETRDIEACEAAGVDFAAVTWGYNHPETLRKEKPAYLVDDMSELLDIVRK